MANQLSQLKLPEMLDLNPQLRLLLRSKRKLMLRRPQLLKIPLRKPLPSSREPQLHKDLLWKDNGSCQSC
jgi:hypothetical protein